MKTLNRIESYAEAGQKAAEAINCRDHARYEHWSKWASRAISMEGGDYKAIANKTFNDAYSENRSMPFRG